MGDLNERFQAFCRQYPGAESIDAIPLTAEQKALKLKRADFFFEERTIICEIKALETETQKKAEEFMKQHGLDPDGLASGQHIVEDLFRKIRTGQNLYNDLVKLVTTPIEAGFDSAARQIADTKKLFDIPSADGLLVILNDTVKMAGPPFVIERLSLAVRKKDSRGQPYHQPVTRILHIGETYLVGTPQGDKHVNATVPNPFASESHGIEAFVAKLAETWATFNDQPFEKFGPEIDKLMANSKLYVDVP